MSIYSDKLAQMCTREDPLAYNIGALFVDNVMSYNSLTTNIHCPLPLGCLFGFGICLGASIKNPDIKTQCLHSRIKDSWDKKLWQIFTCRCFT